jgi:hypothetical protein
MSIGKSLLALAWFSTEVVLAASSAAVPEASTQRPAVELAARELELELARTRDLYLVLDEGRQELAVRARGRTLERFALRGVAALQMQRLVGRTQDPAAALTTPVVLRVTSRPAHGGRPLVAPERLATAAERRPAQATDGPGMTPPARYELGLEGGWRLEIVSRARMPGLGQRLTMAVQTAWRRARGHGDIPPPAIQVGLDAEDARHVHHLFRIGTPVLLLLDTGS